MYKDNNKRRANTTQNTSGLAQFSEGVVNECEGESRGSSNPVIPAMGFARDGGRETKDAGRESEGVVYPHRSLLFIAPVNVDGYQ